MRRQPEADRRSTRPVTITPNPGFRELHRLLGRLPHRGCSTPTVRSLALHLTWSDIEGDSGSVAVRSNDDSLDSHARGYIRHNGSFEKARSCDGETIIALRNLAADPERLFRRYGFETMTCPFCGDRLPHCTLSFGVGYCQVCATLIGWPHDERAAKLAEDALRRDIMREVEDENGIQ